MINGKKILAIIPARGGSKGLPGKNIRPLLGKPLIAWTIEQAQNSKYIDEIFLSTDSADIAKISEDFGVKTPFLRPKDLSSDLATSTDVVSHVITHYETQELFFDFIILLEPTSPLRKENDIDCAIELLLKNESADGIISLGEIHLEHPMIVKKTNSIGKIVPYVKNLRRISQRQLADEAYFPYGVIYMIKTKIFKRKRSFYTNNIIPYFIERWQNYEVDDICDFYAVEAIFNKFMKEQL
jgi:CMP-N,N'-diacetyllegionaminic acid synthase